MATTDTNSSEMKPQTRKRMQRLQKGKKHDKVHPFSPPQRRERKHRLVILQRDIIGFVCVRVYVWVCKCVYECIWMSVCVWVRECGRTREKIILTHPWPFRQAMVHSTQQVLSVVNWRGQGRALKASIIMQQEGCEKRQHEQRTQEYAQQQPKLRRQLQPSQPGLGSTR